MTGLWEGQKMSERDETAKFDAFWAVESGLVESGPVKRHRRRLILKEARKLCFDSVLDVGCGDGTLLRELAGFNPQAALTGVDVSSTILETCKRGLPQGDFAVLDLQADRLERRFDLVVCSEVLEHLVDDRAGAKHLRSMVKEGGHAIITVPSGPFLAYDRAVTHQRTYAKHELAQLLERVGFKVLSTVQWGFPFYSPLYRRLLDRAPDPVSKGVMTRKKRLIKGFLYRLFFLNSARKGDHLMVVVKPEPQTEAAPSP